MPRNYTREYEVDKNKNDIIPVRIRKNKSILFKDKLKKERPNMSLNEFFNKAVDYYLDDRINL